MPSKTEHVLAWTRPRTHLARLRAAPWPATKDELIDFAARTAAPLQLLEDLYALPDDGARYETLDMVLTPHLRGVA